jgi:hypothetical protein
MLTKIGTSKQLCKCSGTSLKLKEIVLSEVEFLKCQRRCIQKFLYLISSLLYKSVISICNFLGTSATSTLKGNDVSISE